MALAEEEMYMKRFISLILFVLCTVYCALGATIYGGSSGKKFEVASNWNTGSLPGTYTDSNSDGVYDFDVSSNTTLYIYGYVKLTGNLNLLNWGNLYIENNAVFIIDGNFNIGDCSDVIIGNKATLYVTGDLETSNVTDRYSYVMFDMYSNSNVVVEGDIASASGADIWIYPSSNSSDPSSDFYVFSDDESTTSKIYKYGNGGGPGGSKLQDGSSLVDGYDEYVNNEASLTEIIAEISENIDSECTTLSITSGTYRLRSDASYCYLDISENASLIIDEGVTLTLTKTNIVNYGTITNYGTIDCGSNDLTILPRIENDKNVCKFYNNGLIKAGNFYLGNSSYLANTNLFSFSCASGIIATNNIVFTILGWTGNLSLPGTYKAKTMTVDYQSGGNTVDFGEETCGGSSTIELESLILKNNVSSININELTGVQELNIQTYSSVALNVDGSLILGNITTSNNQAVGISGSSSSIMTLCYNPSSGQDFGLNGTSNSSNGTIIYRVKYNDSDTYYWDNTANPAHTPYTEQDVTGSPTLKANKVSYSDCMSGSQSLLGMDDDPFLPKDKELLQDYSPCEDDSLFKMRYGNSVYRVYQKELIYCEGDNQ